MTSHTATGYAICACGQCREALPDVARQLRALASRVTTPAAVTRTNFHFFRPLTMCQSMFTYMRKASVLVTLALHEHDY